MPVACAVRTPPVIRAARTTAVARAIPLLRIAPPISLAGTIRHKSPRDLPLLPALGTRNEPSGWAFSETSQKGQRDPGGAESIMALMSPDPIYRRNAGLRR